MLHQLRTTQAVKKMNTIKLATKDQVVLMVCELQGQISDGYWENARPHNHYKGVSGAEVEVANTIDEVGLNFFTQRKYNFAAPMLLECVGDRMIKYVKFARKFPTFPTSYIRYIDSGAWMWTDKYMEKVVENFKTFGITSHTDLQEIIWGLDADQTYQMKHLKKDLKAINVAFTKHF
jgi:hypothetical protein